MSKTPIIKEGATPVTLTCNKLKTNVSGGGTQNWVPEDEVNLGTKNITEDGTYQARADGYYGFSEVTVNGIGKAVGKDPDTGEDKLVKPDPETGILEETILPHSIAVTSLPNKLTYTDGETINYTGMIVKAYLASGEIWTDAQHQGGILAPQELTLPETSADKTKATADEALVPEAGSMYYEEYGKQLILERISVGEKIGGNAEGRSYTVTEAQGNLYAYYEEDPDKQYYTFVRICSPLPFTVRYVSVFDGIETYKSANPISVFGVLCYNYQLQTAKNITGIYLPYVNPLDNPRIFHDIGLLDGDIPRGGIETIPVQYIREDGSMLEDSFDISVTEANDNDI